MAAKRETTVICPIYKKIDKLSCQNYRGMPLLCTTYKILTEIIRRIIPYVEEYIGIYQARFRAGRSTMGQLLMVWQITEKMGKYDVGIYPIFVDLNSVYDSVKRKSFCKAMEELSIPAKLVSITSITMNDSKGKVGIQQTTSNEFDVKQWVQTRRWTRHNCFQ